MHRRLQRRSAQGVCVEAGMLALVVTRLKSITRTLSGALHRCRPKRRPPCVLRIGLGVRTEARVDGPRGAGPPRAELSITMTRCTASCCALARAMRKIRYR